MKIRAQVMMVLNLDKCIGCHTCSVTCKNVWTNRDGVQYAWFNNVETKPGIGYPKDWENQQRWRGGWVRKPDGSLVPRLGGKFRLLAQIFANPHMPEVDDYYEPFDFDYQHLHTAPSGNHQPTARPRSVVSGKRMEKIVNTPGSEITGARGGIHNSVTRIVLKPTHMIGGYAQLSYGFNYYGTIGTNRDEFVVVRKMNRIDWLDTPVADELIRPVQAQGEVA